MASPSIALIYPPVAKPSELPAGIARLSGALKQHGIECTPIDANIQGLHYLCANLKRPTDTWGRRAFAHKQHHLETLRSRTSYDHPDRYRRAAADINRLLGYAGETNGQRVSLVDYHDRHRSPHCSDDLADMFRHPEQNPYHDYFFYDLLPQLAAMAPGTIGISINYLSQALCAFALIGLLRKKQPHARIAIGGGLVTSWQKMGNRLTKLNGMVDDIICGPGEVPLLRSLGVEDCHSHAVPDVATFLSETYLSPGIILPYSASQGCWWRRCSFCPERAEKQPYRPVRPSIAVGQLRQLSKAIGPSLIHLLDNAISPALLKALVGRPPGAPWYGFARMVPPLDDPDFCRHLASSGCVMLKLGLESGDQGVLDALDKGTSLPQAAHILENLHDVGIATYVYLLFGTPTEDEAAALRTQRFITKHHHAIDFLNLAIFNLPKYSPETESLATRAFSSADMALYSDFQHPKGWSRKKVRQFLDRSFKRDPAIRPIILRDPPFFTSNHAAFFHPAT